MTHISAAMQVSDTVVDLFEMIPPEIRPILPWLLFALQVFLLVLAAGVTIVSVSRAWRYLAGQPLEDRLTIVAASIATAVSAQGMWRFTGDVLGLDGPLRVLLFAFIEIAIVTSAVRAKRSMAEHFKAGVDGVAVWALACLTAGLSSLDAASFGEAVFRLASPLVAAWLWERGMRLERRRLRGTTGINWRITPERIAVRLGLAEAADRSAGDVDTQRRITRIGLAAKRAKQLRDAGASERKQRAALSRLDRVFEQAAAHSGLGHDQALQERVRYEVAALFSAPTLMDIAPDSAWVSAAPDPFSRLADETERLNAILAAQHDARSSIANLAMLAAAATGNHLVPSTCHGVDETVVTAIDGARIHTAGGALSSTASSTAVETIEHVDEQVDIDLSDPALYSLERLWTLPASSTPPSTPPSTPGDVDEQVDGEASKTQRMRLFWVENVAQKRYPTPRQLADHAGASRQLAARLRAEWVEELDAWGKRRARKALRASA